MPVSTIRCFVGKLMWLLFIACLMTSFSGAAMADAPAVPGGGLMSFVPMLAFITILYFLLIRPQQKRTKQHKAMVAAVKKGDKVVTSCGILATVSKVVSEQEVVLEIADGVHCKFIKSAISNVVSGDAVASSTMIPHEPKSVEVKADTEEKVVVSEFRDEKLASEKKVAKTTKSGSPIRRKTTTKK